jgi:hypothetical protein
MIVRILGEAQYDVSESDHPMLHDLEVRLDEALDGDDEAAFQAALSALIEAVHRVGTPLPADEFTSSDRVLPFADATLHETKALLDDPGGDR